MGSFRSEQLAEVWRGGRVCVVVGGTLHLRGEFKWLLEWRQKFP